MFGALGRLTGSPQLAFLALLALTVWSLAWLHLAVLRMRTLKPAKEDEEKIPLPTGEGAATA
jgi:NNP family nitrate/nitrite transporter-like MFS transporter